MIWLFTTTLGWLIPPRHFFRLGRYRSVTHGWLYLILKHSIRISIPYPWKSHGNSCRISLMDFMIITADTPGQLTINHLKYACLSLKRTNGRLWRKKNAIFTGQSASGSPNVRSQGGALSTVHASKIFRW